MFTINPKTLRLTTNQATPTRPTSAPMLPSRQAMNQLTKGDPEQRSTLSYAKMTPSGATGMPKTYQDIIDMAHNVGASVLPK
jgi:hypothetical protein